MRGCSGPLPYPALCPQPRSRQAQQLPQGGWGTPRTSSSRWGAAMGLRAAVLQVNQPQVLQIKSVRNQRCLPSRESQELLRLSFCASARRAETTPDYPQLQGFPLARVHSALQPHREKFARLKKNIFQIKYLGRRRFSYQFIKDLNTKM